MITDQHLNTGAMALDALPEDEAALFVEHLDSCPECAVELAGFLQTASALGGSVAQTPPASLRRSVMAAIAQTPQLPPVTGVMLGRHRQEAAKAAAATFAASGSAAAATSATPVDVTTTGSEQLAEVIPLRRPWYRRPQALIAAAAAVLVIGGGTTFVLAQQSGPVANTAGACVAAAPDRSVIAPTVGSGGDVTLAPSCDTAVVKMPALPDAPAGKVYQLWVIKGTGATAGTTSVGIVTKNSDGSYPAYNAAVHAGDTAVGVTLEPSPGSAKPTTTPFWVVPLTA